MDCKTAERQIEAYLVKQVKFAGGRAYKFVSPGNIGVPDRMVCLPGGRVFFVELKAPGKKPDSQQRARHRELRKMGFVVFGCVDSQEDVDGIMIWAQSGYTGVSVSRLLCEMEFFDHE